VIRLGGRQGSAVYLNPFSILTNLAKSPTLTRHDQGPPVPPVDPAKRSDARTAALDYLYGRIDYERLQAPSRRYPFELERMRQLLEALAPAEAQRAKPAPPVVHIAGTKGKGSVSTMVAAMLTANGRRTGLYTSPHLVHLEERFRIDGVPCTADELVALVDTVRRASEQIERPGQGPATFFELTTAMAFQHFRNHACNALVLEVGLGGRLDSTNVCAPQVTAITSIGLDHQHILGDTLPEIAVEKAGIIKPGVPVISGVQDPEAADVIRTIAEEVGAPLWEIGRDFQVDCFPCEPDDPADPTEPGNPPPAPWGSRLDFRSQTKGLRTRRGWTLALEGMHQADNAAIALAIIDALEQQGTPVDDAAQRKGLAHVVCEGRVERFPGPPEVILDTAHNEDSIAALVKVVAARRQGRRTAVVFVTSRDKDAPAMLRRLAEVTDQLLLTRFHGNPRWQDPARLESIWQRFQIPLATYPQPLEALALACDVVGPDGLVVVCGSFFLAAETRPWLVARQGIVQQ
jgi:dihydrofolate synthase/folylpolyglutamate synthase